MRDHRESPRTGAAEYRGEQWDALARTWRPGPAEYAGGTWRRVLVNREAPVPVSFRRDSRWPVPPLRADWQASKLADWIIASGSQTVHVFTAGAGSTPAMREARAVILRNLARRGWKGAVLECNPADFTGPTPDTGAAASTEERDTCHA